MTFTNVQFFNVQGSVCPVHPPHIAAFERHTEVTKDRNGVSGSFVNGSAVVGFVSAAGDVARMMYVNDNLDHFLITAQAANQVTLDRPYPYGTDAALRFHAIDSPTGTQVNFSPLKGAWCGV